jgi:hypothetical protein
MDLYLTGFRLLTEWNLWVYQSPRTFMFRASFSFWKVTHVFALIWQVEVGKSLMRSSDYSSAFRVNKRRNTHLLLQVASTVMIVLSSHYCRKSKILHRDSVNSWGAFNSSALHNRSS